MKNYSLRTRVLVTGGAGFLGSHLCERCSPMGRCALRRQLLYRRAGAISLICSATRDSSCCATTLRFRSMSRSIEIYNLACPASPVHYQFDPVQTTKTSVIGAINMLGLAKRMKARILQASTSEVYGDPSVHRNRNYWGHVNPIGLRSPATTRASAAPRRCFSTTSGSTNSISRWSGSSTPMDRGCIRTTAASSATSSCRH